FMILSVVSAPSTVMSCAPAAVITALRIAGGTTCGEGGDAGGCAGGVGVAGSCAEVSVLAQVKSAGVTALALRIVLPEINDGVRPRKSTWPPPVAKVRRRSSAACEMIAALGRMTVL